MDLNTKIEKYHFKTNKNLVFVLLLTEILL